MGGRGTTSSIQKTQNLHSLKRRREPPVQGFGQMLKHRLHLGTLGAFRSSRERLKRAMRCRLATGSTLHQTRATIQRADITRIPLRAKLALRMRARLAGFVGGKRQPSFAFPDLLSSVFYTLSKKQIPSIKQILSCFVKSSHSLGADWLASSGYLSL